MTFDVSKFVNATYSASTSTKFPVPDEGDYVIQLGAFDEKTWLRVNSFKDKNTGEDREMVSLEIPVEILDDGQRQKLGISKVTSRYKCILDLDANGDLDFSEGKNVRLGRLRDVLGQNDPSQPWSIQMLANKGPLMGHVAITTDKNDADKKYSEISRVTKMSG